MVQFENNAIFWIEVEKIKPNPFQPRKEFDEGHLRDLADSIRQYGVLQPLVVTRKETEHASGGLSVEYELIAGERRLRAAKIAGVARVPTIIQSGTTDPRLKLELAIIENLQREDLNPVDRALAFPRLAQEFGFRHTEIAKKVGKSREYVSNSLRLLVLPQEVLSSLSQGQITEGHARPLMMLADKKEEQVTLFKEIVAKKLTVREAEDVARHIAKDRLRKKLPPDPEIERIEKELSDSLGTRVSIERRQVGGGKLVIDFFSNEDLRTLLSKVHPAVSQETQPAKAAKNMHANSTEENGDAHTESSYVSHAKEQQQIILEEPKLESTPLLSPVAEPHEETIRAIDQEDLLREKKNDYSDGALYSVNNFTV